MSGIKPSLDCHARKRKKKTYLVLTILLISLSRSPKTKYLVNIIHLEIRLFADQYPMTISRAHVLTH